MGRGEGGRRDGEREVMEKEMREGETKRLALTVLDAGVDVDVLLVAVLEVWAGGRGTCHT